MARRRKVMVVGSGAREHALSVCLSRAPSVSEVFVCPGNGGSANASNGLFNVSGDVVDAATQRGVDLVVIGPEAPLCAGLADRLRQKGITTFGPSQAAARLEGSKIFMKRFAERYGIRTSPYQVVTHPAELEPALASFAEPPVVKADGLCAGKGVTVAETFEQARSVALEMLSGERFGEAGTRLLLEERVRGTEASVHGICDGHTALLLPPAQDYKRIFDGDRGPNTGGMGCYLPASNVDTGLLEDIERQVFDKTLAGMRQEDTPFVGTLYAGLMITPEREPVLIEFNVRLGDPETQVLTVVMDGDLADVFVSAATGKVDKAALSPSSDAALCVVLAAEGYPASPRLGEPIEGVAAAEEVPGVHVFHAGTRRGKDGLFTAGGRVLSVTARAPSLGLAKQRAYNAVERIRFSGMQFRGDIGDPGL